MFKMSHWNVILQISDVTEALKSEEESEKGKKLNKKVHGVGYAVHHLSVQVHSSAIYVKHGCVFCPVIIFILRYVHVC